MANPCANSSRLPGAIPSRISDSQMSCWRSSGSSTITTSPSLAGRAPAPSPRPPGGRVGDRLHAQPVALRLLDRRGVGPQAHHHVHAGVLQVERVGVALRAVAEDRDGLAVEEIEVRVLVVDHRGGTLLSRPLSSFPDAVRGSAPTRSNARGTL